MDREVVNDDLIISINNEGKAEIMNNFGLKEVSDSLSKSPEELKEKDNKEKKSVSEISDNQSSGSEELKNKETKNEITTRVGRVVKQPNKLNL